MAVAAFAIHVSIVGVMAQATRSRTHLPLLRIPVPVEFAVAEHGNLRRGSRRWMMPGSAVVVGCVGDSARGMGMMPRSSGPVVPLPLLLLLLALLQVVHLLLHLGLVFAAVVLEAHHRVDAA